MTDELNDYHGWVDSTSPDDLPNRVYVCGWCNERKVVPPEQQGSRLMPLFVDVPEDELVPYLWRLLAQSERHIQALRLRLDKVDPGWATCKEARRD